MTLRQWLRNLSFNFHICIRNKDLGLYKWEIETEASTLHGPANCYWERMEWKTSLAQGTSRSLSDLDWALGRTKNLPRTRSHRCGFYGFHVHFPLDFRTLHPLPKSPWLFSSPSFKFLLLSGVPPHPQITSRIPLFPYTEQFSYLQLLSTLIYLGLFLSWPKSY